MDDLHLRLLPFPVDFAPPPGRHAADLTNRRPATTRSPKRWRGARTTASITSSASGTGPLSKKVGDTADAVRTKRAIEDKGLVRGYAETRHKAKSWDKERRAVARIEATRLGLDIRFVVTNLAHGSPEWLDDSLYLRARAGGKSDQAAQGAAALRSNFMSIVARQSGAPRAAHGRLWADAHRPRSHPRAARVGDGRICDPAPSPAENRRPRRRDRDPGKARLRRRLSRSRAVPIPPGGTPHAERTMRDGAQRPLPSIPFLQRVPKVRNLQRRKTPNDPARPAAPAADASMKTSAS